MMGKEIDPSDIGKYPKIIRAAQNDMAQTDVLVCGNCYSVFHFIELFQEHKDIGCEKDSDFKDTRETKPKIWAFLLWKAAKLNSPENSGNATNSWKCYQQWLKMEDSVRETWIVAGKTIQSFARMGQGNLQEMPVKITKTIVDNTTRGINQQKPGPRVIDNRQVFRKEPNVGNDEDLSPARADKNLLRKPVNQSNPTKISPGNAIANKSPNRRANRTIPNTNGQEIEEETVEKIIAKRFNPRRKMHEYLVKWEKYPHEQNTWEPQTHLESCPQLLDTFEKQLARQKEQRAAQAAKQAATVATPASNQTKLPVVKTEVSPSQQNQILRNNTMHKPTDSKLWVQDESSGGTLKRKLNDSEDLEDSGDVDDPGNGDDIGAQPAKKMRNGTAILRMDSSGDVKISQVPTPVNRTVNGSIKSGNKESSAEVIVTKDNQSSGIVKKAGVVPTNSQKPEAQVRVLARGDNAASGIVRVNKIPAGGITAGQTRITQITSGGPQKTGSNSSTPSPRNNIAQNKILPRPIVSPNAPPQASKTIINRATQPQPDNSKVPITPEQKILQLSQKNDLKVTRKIVHSTQPQNQTVQQTSPRTTLNKVSTSIELPDDPFQEPQSPPPPLTLCPVTGKVLGQAEGEPSTVHSPEPVKKENEVNKLQNQRANITSVGILQTNDQPRNSENVPEELSLATAAEGGQHVLTSEDGTPLLVTGDDGTIYQVAGKNAEGQTILIAQGPDGEQQYAYLAAEEGDEAGGLTLDNAVAEAVAQMLPKQEGDGLAASGDETGFILKHSDGSTESTEGLTIQTEGDSQDGNIPAEVVQADLPSPGGTRRVVLLLQDGTFMMTEMHDDEYQALNIVT